MSCGQLALGKANIDYNKYYASEIDKYAIKVTQENYPDTIQLGDVEAWESWDIEKPDMVIGGGPCQGFSYAGKGLNFDDPRSKLFFTFVDIVKYYKPKYFLFENVKMKKEWQDIISTYLGVEPILINSALVSAQNRKRLYWTNIPNIIQPEDKKIYLKDIIEYGIVDRDKSYCIDANYFKGGNLDSYFDKKRRRLVFGGSVRGRRINEKGKRDDYNYAIKPRQRVELNNEPKSNALTTVQKDNILLSSKYYDKPLRIATYGNGSQGQRIYSKNGKSVTLSAHGGGWGAKTGLYYIEGNYRKLTPVECERLQTVPDNYTNSVSNTQRYRMLGNGWTIDIIAHIFSFIK